MSKCPSQIKQDDYKRILLFEFNTDGIQTLNDGILEMFHEYFG